MKTSEALYELIHSLSKNEKRYFKLYCTGLSGRDGSNYLLLFEALEKQKEYDYEALKRSLKKPSLVKNLSSEKNYLFNLILDSLLAFHKEQPEYRIRMMMSKAQLLYDKSLVKASYKLLMSAKKLANTYGKRSMLFDILTLQSTHFLNARDVTLLEECVKEEYELAQEVINVNRYNAILAELINAANDTSYSRRPDQLKKWDEIMQNELMQDENKATSLQAKIMFYHIWAYYYHMAKQPGNITEINRKIVKLFEDNFDYTSVHLNDYLGVLANFMSDAMARENREDLTAGMKKLDEFPVTYDKYISPVVHDNYRQLYLENAAKVNAWKGEYEKTIALLPEMQALVANERVLKYHRRQTVAFNTALALFAVKRYKEALRLLQEITSTQNAEKGSYVYFMQAMFLRLMIHCELENYDVLEEHSTWLRQFLSKHNKLHRTEDVLLSFFASLPGCMTNREREKLFTGIFSEMNELINDNFEASFLRALRFIYKWVKARTTGKQFIETAVQTSF